MSKWVKKQKDKKRKRFIDAGASTSQNRSGVESESRGGVEYDTVL